MVVPSVISEQQFKKTTTDIKEINQRMKQQTTVKDPKKWHTT
jgi:hypothetical protein